MKKLNENERFLYLAAGILMFSILLMLAVIPGILNDTFEQAKPKGAATAVSVAAAIHLVILLSYLFAIRKNRSSKRKRKGEYLGVGILLLLFGLIYMDGAFAFFAHKDILYVSILMFISVLCDLVASTLMITAYITKR